MIFSILVFGEFDFSDGFDLQCMHNTKLNLCVRQIN